METNPYAAPNAPLDVGPRAGDEPVRVGFWPRVGASLIDGVVVWLLGALIAGFLAAHFPEYLAELIARSRAKMDPKAVEQMASALKFADWMVRWSLGAMVVGTLYGLLEGLTGRALGKLLLGLRIAGLDARPASLGRLLGRAAFKQSTGLLGVLAMLTGSYRLSQIAQIPAWVVMVGFLFVLAAHKRALHDLAAGTAVFHNTDVAATTR